MRKRYTFVLTILPSEEDMARLQGRLSYIHNGKTATFSDAEELQELIHKTILTDSEAVPVDTNLLSPQRYPQQENNGVSQEPDL